jgi:hypothetical protein
VEVLEVVGEVAVADLEAVCSSSCLRSGLSIPGRLLVEMAWN